LQIDLVHFQSFDFTCIRRHSSLL